METPTGIELIAAERQRQIEAEGYTSDRDDVLNGGSLAVAAACYAMHATWQQDGIPLIWPWDDKVWKPKGTLSDLIRGGALIAAEIDRIQRAAAKEDRPMDLDYEFDERECLRCGYSPTHIRHCSECGGEGEFDCYDEDPINFSPGEEMEACETCNGSGIEHWCPKCGADQLRCVSKA